MQKLFQDFSVPAVFAGFITFLIGISVSSVLVIQSAQVLGANTAQINSWFWALGLGIGLSGLLLSWKLKYPVSTSWSTAALALIIATGSGYSLHEAIGAFLVCGLVTAILGFSVSLKSTDVYPSKPNQCHAGRCVIEVWYFIVRQYARSLGFYFIHASGLYCF